jgi:hypothetical protein
MGDERSQLSVKATVPKPTDDTLLFLKWTLDFWRGGRDRHVYYGRRSTFDLDHAQIVGGSGTAERHAENDHDVVAALGKFFGPRG